MPVDRAESTPRNRANNVVTMTAMSTPVQGFMPNWRPRPLSATTLPTANPATPNINHWASDTMPPYADRNTSDDAARPSINVRVITKSTKKSEPNSGSSARNAHPRTAATVRPDGVLTPPPRTGRSAAPPARRRGSPA